MNFVDLFSQVLITAALPMLLGTLIGILVAYSVIASILGALLWAGKSVPDDVGIAITLSGLVTGLLLAVATFYVRWVLANA